MEIFPVLSRKSSQKSSNLDKTSHKDTKTSILPLLGKKQVGHSKKKKTVTINENPTVLPVIGFSSEEKQCDNENDLTATKGQTQDKRKDHYTMQCELVYERIAQQISRPKYSYFKPIPSPPPLRRKEKLYKAYQDSVKKNGRAEREFSVCARTPEQYEKMRAELENIQEQFIRRHNIYKKKRP